MAAPKGNKNAEKWTFDVCKDILERAVELSKNPDYDFIGEVAFDMDLNRANFQEFTEKFPELEPLRLRVLSNCESNCFRNSKKGNINTAIGIVNLKSNHGWTDRTQTDVTTNGKDLSFPVISIDPLADYESNNGTSKDS